jgi:hypothetical protein
MYVRGCGNLMLCEEFKQIFQVGVFIQFFLIKTSMKKVIFHVQGVRIISLEIPTFLKYQQVVFPKIPCLTQKISSSWTKMRVFFNFF